MQTLESRFRGICRKVEGYRQVSGFDAAYGDTGMTYGEIIEFYTMSLENTLNFGGYKSGRERNQ